MKWIRVAWIAATMFSSVLWAGLPHYNGRPFADEMHRTGPARIPGIIQCALFDLGGEGVAYHDTTSRNEGSDVLNRQVEPHNHQRIHASEHTWHFRSEEAVDISFAKDWADLNHPNAVSPPLNQFYIGWADEGEWVNYTVEVAAAGRYAIGALYSNRQTEVSFAVDGALTAACRVPRPTEGWHHWDYGRVGEIEFTEPGLHVLTFYYGAGNNWAFFVFEPLRD